MNPSRRDAACPLCGHADSRPYHQDRRRVYRQCPRCALVFVPSAFHLAPEAEKAEYDRHENALDAPGYRRFLSRMAEPMLARLPPAASGLDFGCGPAPLLAELFRQAGHRMAVYDLYYANNPDALTGRYDFITCTETLEHLARPAGTLARWLDLLAPGGLLGIMTKRVRDHAAFSRWHYIQDPTHIAFYADATFEFLAREYGLALEVIGPDVVIMQKKPHRPGA
ncbi:MAG: class I SAM-dependent methyltransferase [Chromatiales bacterium]|nr:class I SAM-dependent methyltransferase [Chromatiales bacterium]